MSLSSEKLLLVWDKFLKRNYDRLDCFENCYSYSRKKKFFSENLFASKHDIFYFWLYFYHYFINSGINSDRSFSFCTIIKSTCKGEWIAENFISKFFNYQQIYVARGFDKIFIFIYIRVIPFLSFNCSTLMNFYFNYKNKWKMQLASWKAARDISEYSEETISFFWSSSSNFTTLTF